MPLLTHFCPTSSRNWRTESLQLPHVKDGQKEGGACITATISCSESHRCHLTDWLPPPSPWPFPSTPGSGGSGVPFTLRKVPTAPWTHSPLSAPCVTAVSLLIRPLIPHRTLFPGWLGPLCHSHTHAVFLRKTACSESFHTLALRLSGSLVPLCWPVSAALSMSPTSSSPMEPYLV